MKHNKNFKKSRSVNVGDDFDEKIKKPTTLKQKPKYRHRNHWLEEDDDFEDISLYKQEEE